MDTVIYFVTIIYCYHCDKTMSSMNIQTTRIMRPYIRIIILSFVCGTRRRPVHRRCCTRAVIVVTAARRRRQQQQTKDEETLECLEADGYRVALNKIKNI